MQDFLHNFWAVCLELAFPLFIGAAAAGGLGLLFQKKIFFLSIYRGVPFRQFLKRSFLVCLFLYAPVEFCL